MYIYRLLIVDERKLGIYYAATKYHIYEFDSVMQEGKPEKENTK